MPHKLSECEVQEVNENPMGVLFICWWFSVKMGRLGWSTGGRIVMYAIKKAKSERKRENMDLSDKIRKMGKRGNWLNWTFIFSFIKLHVGVHRHTLMKSTIILQSSKFTYQKLQLHHFRYSYRPSLRFEMSLSNRVRIEYHILALFLAIYCDPC